jgi:aldose sugar dehydrogenase
MHVVLWVMIQKSAASLNQKACKEQSQNLNLTIIMLSLFLIKYLQIKVKLSTMRRQTIYMVLFIYGALLSLANAKAVLTGKSAGQDYQVVEVFTGLKIPWGMAFLSADSMLVTQRSGEMILVDLRQSSSTIITGAPKVKSSGQGGLLDVKVGPNYATDGWIYLTYSKPTSGNAVTTLARFKLKGSSIVDLEDILVTQSLSNKSQHFGSRIAFDDQGFVYFSIGDRGVRPNGQDLQTHAGSIVRLHLDGRVPKTNPFIANKHALNEIWSWGHRNPQGVAFDPVTKKLWSIEHGPRGGDEINLIEKGNNYGWPTISYGKEYWGPLAVGESTHKEGMQQPVKYYVPSIAPSSLLIYRGASFPHWQGNLFAGALAKTHINRIIIDEKGKAVGEERLVEALNQRVRSLAVSTQGLLYFATDNGVIYRIEPVI